MTRRIFFSFHFERDCWRAGQVRNSWLTKPDRANAGFWDAATWEKVKKEGEVAVKRWINKQLENTSVTVVLIGTETSSRKYVRYEIQKSIERGNGIVAVYIHNLKAQKGETDKKGDLDFGKIDGEHDFSELYHIYDWVNDNGYENLGDWVERAALIAGRSPCEPPATRSTNRPSCVR